jgi:hypothetical protein
MKVKDCGLVNHVLVEKKIGESFGSLLKINLLIKYCCGGFEQQISFVKKD